MAACCTKKEKTQPCSCIDAPDHNLKPDFPVVLNDADSCCNSSLPETLSRFEKPGYHLWGFVQNFIDTPAGKIPRVRTNLIKADHMETLAARIGIGRDNYHITPGLYAVGAPDKSSPVMVSANYKLSFDVLRQALKGLSAWIMVLNTRGINVWCAAGKGTFSTNEVAKRVKTVKLDQIVSHRQLILPQLAATGVAARQVKRMCAFEVLWGPIHSRNINAFLKNGNVASPTMRQVTFSLKERVELIPFELNSLRKATPYIIAVLLILSSFGKGVFTFNAVISRGIPAIVAYLLAIFSGAVMTPILLPWLPGPAFAIKGAFIGLAAGIILAAAAFTGPLNWPGIVALMLFIIALSSYLGMNFTGSTPYTSPTGVEIEMRKAIPIQLITTIAAFVLWVSAGFMGQ